MEEKETVLNIQRTQMEDQIKSVQKAHLYINF
jgi:hypothetical protein